MKLSRAAGAMIPHVEPLASRMITRAQRNAVDWTDLCSQLADNINSPDERQAFLHDVGGSGDK